MQRYFLAALLSLSLAACSHAVVKTIDDAAVTAGVKTVLLNDPHIAGWKIDVETAAGVVTLSGVVSSAAEEQRAVQLVRGVEGVREVQSRLQTATATPQF